MTRIIGFNLLFLLATTASAQMDWNWPEDAELLKATKEKQAYYKIQIQTNDQQGAYNTLNWLFINTPDLHESIYKDGAKIFDNLLEMDISEERRKRLEDSLLWTYDMRMKYFDGRPSVMDRKAYSAFKLYYKTAKKYPMLLALYEELYSYSSEDISDFNLTPYMTLASYYYRSNPEELTPEKVMDIHTRITEVIDQKLTSVNNKERLEKEQDKVDAFLNSLGDILSCDFIEEKLVPKFDENPNDLNTAKKIFSYSIKAKCSNQPYFTRAGETLVKAEPSHSLAKALGDKYYSSRDYKKAIKYYSLADSLTDDPEKRFDALMGQASTLSKMGNKSKARSYAYEALSVQPGSKEALNFVGNLYFLSFEECRAGESKVKDRGVFLAAYEMYEKANNTEQMEAARAQFPSIEEIFNEEYEEGQKITVDCWINESVQVRRR